MAVTTAPISTPADRAVPHTGQVVGIRLTKAGTQHHMTGEFSSPVINRGVSRSLTLWVEGRASTDRFRLEMCYYPVFDSAGNFLPASSKWAQIGQIVALSATGGLVASQTFDDLGYAVRVVRVAANGTPTAGTFDVYVWALSG